MTRPLRARPRRTPEVVGLLTGAAVLLATALLAATGGVPSWERALFRLLNGAAVPVALLWTLMQLGNVVAVPVGAVLAAAARRRRLAVELLLAGTCAYLAAKVLKVLVDRGRPADVLTDVHLRAGEDAGHGFPSGHAAVAVSLACVVLPRLGPRARQAVVAAAALVCLARVLVGAHLPLDVVGGAALGMGCAAALLLASGRSRVREC